MKTTIRTVRDERLAKLDAEARSMARERRQAEREVRRAAIRFNKFEAARARRLAQMAVNLMQDADADLRVTLEETRRGYIAEAHGFEAKVAELQAARGEAR